MDKDGWRPIEDDTPRDGARILVFTRWLGDAFVEPFDYIQIAFWDGGNLTDDVWHREPGWQMEKIGSPTHWMPLPPPPQGARP
jgi:hypothetical protein